MHDATVKIIHSFKWNSYCSHTTEHPILSCYRKSLNNAFQETNHHS